MRQYTNIQKRKRIVKLVKEARNVIWYKTIRENIENFNKKQYKEPNIYLLILLKLFGSFG